MPLKDLSGFSPLTLAVRPAAWLNPEWESLRITNDSVAPIEPLPSSKGWESLPFSDAPDHVSCEVSTKEGSGPERSAYQGY